MQIGKRRLSVRGAAWRRPTATPNEEMKEEEKERFTPSPPTRPTTEGGRNGRGENGRTDKRGLNSVAARFMSRGGVDLGGKDDTDDDAFPAG